MFSGQQWSSKPRVLVVDDEPLSRTVVAMRIASLGADVIEADSGGHALELLLTEPFDAAILDLEMPGVDGYELLGCIRGHPRLRHMTVIVLSGHDDRQSIQKALQAGATSYLLKPLNWTAFGEHIRFALGLRTEAMARQASL